MPSDPKSLPDGSKSSARKPGRPPTPVPQQLAEEAIAWLEQGKTLTPESGSKRLGRPFIEVAIYGLCDQSGTIRYIGKANNPKNRLKQHIRESLKSRGVNKHKEAWIRSVYASGGKIELLILEWCNSSEWQHAERRWISEYAETLTNQTPGGIAPTCSMETRVANAKQLNAHSERALMMAIRVMNNYARVSVRNGNQRIARKLIGAVVSLKESKGETRKRLIAWAEERFNYETSKIKAA